MEGGPETLTLWSGLCIRAATCLTPEHDTFRVYGTLCSQVGRSDLPRVGLWLQEGCWVQCKCHSKVTSLEQFYKYVEQREFCGKVVFKATPPAPPQKNPSNYNHQGQRIFTAFQCKGSVFL